MKIFWLLLLSTIYIPLKIVSYQHMIIKVPISNLRFEPEDNAPGATLPTSDMTNPLQITQLLLGEHIIVHDQTSQLDSQGNLWFQVNALQQRRFDDVIMWHGYPGWIMAQDIQQTDSFLPSNAVVRKQSTTLYNQAGQKIEELSIGTRLYTKPYNDIYLQTILPNHTIALINQQDIYPISSQLEEPLELIRANIIATARTFLDSWYSWGGRSSQISEHIISSVDCSALIHLSFLAHGLQLARMSHEQYVMSHKIHHGKDLQAGDLIFFSSPDDSSGRMNHVMLYLGDNLILETTFAGEHKARIISFQDRLKTTPDCITNGDIVYDQDDSFRVHFGTYFHSLEQLQKLRDYCLQTTYDEEYYDASAAVWQKKQFLKTAQRYK